MTSDPPNASPQAREQEIERLAQELGRLIRGADSQRRDDLKEMAFALIREELIHEAGIGEASSNAQPAAFNPLGTGVLIFFLGAGLSFIFGPVGLMLMLGGLLFVVWGAVITWFKG